MDPMTLSLISAGVGGGIGGISGFKSSMDRVKQLMDDQRLLGWQYEATQKQKASQRSILEGNLSVGTLDTNTARKQAAIEAAVAEGQARAMAGTSGASGGTPFYALDKQMFENQDMLNQVDYKTSLHLGQSGKQLDAAMSEYNTRLGAMGLQGATLNQDLNYALSTIGFLMPVFTGAASGASAGLGVANTLVGAGFTTEAVNPKATSGYSQSTGYQTQQPYRPNQPPYKPIQMPQAPSMPYGNSPNPTLSSNFFNINAYGPGNGPTLWKAPNLMGY
jgi:hypothetical protein